MFGDQCCYDTFQSTPPIRVATWPSKNVQVFLRISIHATHTGGDMVSCGWWKRINHFNPRHPYGWRPGLSAFRTNGRLFQSTPPMLTASPKGFQSTPPIRVATSNVVFKPCERLFQSTPPIRVATGTLSHVGWLSIFQSTPPIRVATMGLLIRFKGGGFQSTPPIRVATRLDDSNLITLCNFNPRHPYGWRRRHDIYLLCCLIFQSTPPIRVATIDASGFGTFLQFQSTPPIRVATAPLYLFPSFLRISIHATHTGGD